MPEAQRSLLAPAAIEQQINNLIIHHAYRMIVHFKNVARQHNDLAPAAIEQQINNLIIHHAYGMIVHLKNVVNTLFWNVVH